MQSGLNFEAAGSSVVLDCFSSYLLRRLRVTVNMTWALFLKTLERVPAPCLADFYGAPPIGTLLQDYCIIFSVSVVDHDNT